MPQHLTLGQAVVCIAHPRKGHALLQHGLADTISIYGSCKQSLEKVFQYLSASVLFSKEFIH